MDNFEIIKVFFSPEILRKSGVDVIGSLWVTFWENKVLKEFQGGINKMSKAGLVYLVKKTNVKVVI